MLDSSQHPQSVPLGRTNAYLHLPVYLPKSPHQKRITWIVRQSTLQTSDQNFTWKLRNEAIGLLTYEQQIQWRISLCTTERTFHNWNIFQVGKWQNKSHPWVDKLDLWNFSCWRYAKKNYQGILWVDEKNRWTSNHWYSFRRSKLSVHELSKVNLQAHKKQRAGTIPGTLP